MKIRSDFVTNSSSSSFILAFNSEEEIDEFKNKLPQYWKEEILDSIVADIKEGLITKEEAVEYFKRNISTWSLRYKGKDVWKYSWQKLENEKSDVYKFVKKYKYGKVKEFIEKIKEFNVFSKIEYSDNDGELSSNLEHEIMPYTSHTVESFSHH